MKDMYKHGYGLSDSEEEGDMFEEGEEGEGEDSDSEAQGDESESESEAGGRYVKISKYPFVPLSIPFCCYFRFSVVVLYLFF